jgi:hypothetical protein
VSIFTAKGAAYFVRFSAMSRGYFQQSARFFSELCILEEQVIFVIFTNKKAEKL